MVRIEKLPAELERRLPEIRDDWLRVGLSTQPADRPEAEAAIDEVYAAGGLKPPRLKIWLRSPLEGAWGAVILKNGRGIGAQVRAQVRDQVRDQVWAQVGAQVRDQVWDQVWAQVGAQVRDQVWDQVGAQVWAQVGAAGYGQHDANWLAWLETFDGLVSQVERTKGLRRLARACGWWWPFENAVILTERPTILARDDANRLHSDIGPALQYPDGFSIYAWHGLRIPEKFITERDKITVEQIEAESNTEHRRVLLEIFGFARYEKERGAKLIAVDELHGKPRRLMEIKIGRDRLRYVHVVNGSNEPDGTRREFHLGAQRDVKTPHDAIAWSYGINPTHARESVRT